MLCIRCIFWICCTANWSKLSFGLRALKTAAYLLHYTNDNSCWEAVVDRKSCSLSNQFYPQHLQPVKNCQQRKKPRMFSSSTLAVCAIAILTLLWLLNYLLAYLNYTLPALHKDSYWSAPRANHPQGKKKWTTTPSEPLAQLKTKYPIIDISK